MCSSDLEEDKDSINHPDKLTSEATFINQNFSQQVLSADATHAFATAASPTGLKKHGTMYETASTPRAAACLASSTVSGGTPRPLARSARACCEWSPSSVLRTLSGGGDGASRLAV